MNDQTPTDPDRFLQNLVHGIRWPSERPAISWPLSDGRQPVVAWPDTPVSGKHTHVSVGLFRINDTRDRAQFHRRSESWTGNVALVLDDVGEEKHGRLIVPPDLEPTVIVETKPGSQQFWYCFREPVRDAEAIATAMQTLVEAGFGDAGGSTGRTSLIRLARLPGSDPKARGFPARIVFEDWRRRFIPDIPRLFGSEGFNIPLAKTRALGLGSTTSTPIDTPLADPMVQWLASNGWLVNARVSSQGWVETYCPFADDHSVDPKTGFQARTGCGFHVATPPNVACQHSSCKHNHRRRAIDFLTAWGALGAPVHPDPGTVDADAAIRCLIRKTDLGAMRDFAGQQGTKGRDLAWAIAAIGAGLMWQETAVGLAVMWWQKPTEDAIRRAMVVAWHAHQIAAADWPTREKDLAVFTCGGMP